jgi:putative transcriptional regulator
LQSCPHNDLYASYEPCFFERVFFFDSPAKNTVKELSAEKSFHEGKRITLQEVADGTGAHKTTLSKMQQPVGHNVTTASLDDLCDYF